MSTITKLKQGKVTPYEVTTFFEKIYTMQLKQHCLGDLSDVVPPDPIPNSEVKRISADNSDTRKGS